MDTNWYESCHKYAPNTTVYGTSGLSVSLETAEAQETAAYRRGIQIGITYGLLFSVLVSALCGLILPHLRLSWVW